MPIPNFYLQPRPLFQIPGSYIQLVHDIIWTYAVISNYKMSLSELLISPQKPILPMALPIPPSSCSDQKSWSHP